MSIELFFILVILALILIIQYKEWRIGHLERELKNAKEVETEYEFYYGLAEALWKAYRQYEIFPSKFARDIDEMSKWY